MSRNNGKHTNPEMIIIARESRGFTQKELAERINLSSAQLSRIEVGLRTVQKEQLTKLSGILNYPTEFFLQAQPVYGLGISEVFHRKHRDVADRTLNSVYSQIYIRSMELSKLLKEVDIGTINIKPIEIEDFNGDASEIARLVRAGWKLPHGPIRNLVDIIEDARGIVIPFDFGTNRIDAISHWPSGIPPLFFVNAYSSTDRLRFTLCHELAHIIMHHSPDPCMEQQANDFAAEFLMPAKDIRSYFTDLSLAKLADLKRYWKVSMAALLKRATDLEVISKRRARTLWAEFSRSGYRIREPMELDIPREKPTLLREIIESYTEDMDYSVSELAEILCLNKQEVIKIYFESEKLIKEKERKAEHRAERKAAIEEVEQLLNFDYQ